MSNRVGSIGQWSMCAARTVKYIANSPAKNISSLDSHTMVPTLTMFGLVRECTLPGSKPWACTDVVAVMRASRADAGRAGTRPAQRSGGVHSRGHYRPRVIGTGGGGPTPRRVQV